jgi:uncharacterized protein (DUF2384 family)
MATELIAWLRSKTRVLYELPWAVLRAVITRWTAHYVAFRRLTVPRAARNRRKHHTRILLPNGSSPFVLRISGHAISAIKR